MPDAAYYRAQAQRCRRYAGMIRGAPVRLRLLELAVRLEEQGDLVEKMEAPVEDGPPAPRGPRLGR